LLAVLLLVGAQGLDWHSKPKPVPAPARALWVQADFRDGQDYRFGVWVDVEGAYCILNRGDLPGEREKSCSPTDPCALVAGGDAWRAGTLTNDERAALEILSAPNVYEAYAANDYYRRWEKRSERRSAPRVAVTLSSPPPKERRDPSRFYPVGGFSGVFLEGAAENGAPTVALMTVLRNIESNRRNDPWCRNAP
jgi:hypothetical protein